MKFFLPGAKNRAEADVVLEAIAKFIEVPLPKRRIFRLSFRHNRQDFQVEVGKPIPSYYREGEQPVIAILGESPIRICLENRGVLRGSPIFVGDKEVLAIEFFEWEETDL